MRGWGVSDGVEASGRIGEGGRGSCSRILLQGYFFGGGVFSLAFLEGRGGAGRWGIYGEILQSEVRVKGSRGED